jgi:hypothetical protein
MTQQPSSFSSGAIEPGPQGPASQTNPAADPSAANAEAAYQYRTAGSQSCRGRPPGAMFLGDIGDRDGLLWTSMPTSSVLDCDMADLESVACLLAAGCRAGFGK